MKSTFYVVILALITPWAHAQTNLTELLQQGMFEEQANHNLNAAIADYQALSTQFDKDRQLAATAIFRMGECYREDGLTNQAAIEYRRILSEFPDQKTLATLSRENLTGMGASLPATATGSSPINISASTIWDKVKNLPQPELEKVLPTLIPDLELTSLLKQRDEAEVTLAQKRQVMSEANPTIAETKAMLGTINQQISNRISGIMEALKIEYTQSASTERNVPADEEDQEIARIKQMIQNSPDLINAPNDHGHTPLEKASMDGSLKVAAFLLDHGADVNAGKFSALNLAANAGNRAMVEFLLSRGADINTKAWAGETPLHTAASEGYKAVTEALLANMANVNARNDSGATPLLEAAQNGHVQIVRMLLDAGADPNITDKQGRAPLSYAATSGSAETLKALLAAKADPNGGTLDAPLLCAIDKQDLASAELLLQDGADPNVDGLMHCPQNSYGSRWYGDYSAALRNAPALWLAIQEHQLPMVQLLLKYKANPDNSQISEPPAVIFWALSDTNILQTLLNAGANPNLMRGSDNRTPLSIAAENNMLDAVKLLLAAKANPTELKTGTMPPILSAIPYTNILETLLDAGANPNVTFNNGGNPASPLLSAINGGNAVAVAILLKHRADPNLNLPGHDKPLFLATYRFQEEDLRLLLNAGADPNVQNVQGHTPLKILESGNWTDQQKATAASMADLLRQHGALEALPDWDRITASRPSTKYSNPVFYKETNDWNQFTLYELLGVKYGLLLPSVHRNWQQGFNYQYSPGNEVHNDLQFPDFSRVIIHRPPFRGTNWTELKLDIAHALDSGDCSADVPLKFGDVVEIPETDHILNAQWIGLSTNQLFTLAHCLTRQLQITVNGTTTNITVGPQVNVQRPSSYLRNQNGELTWTAPIVNLSPETFMLWPVLDDSQLLLSSSDLSRVRVNRRDPATGQIHEWTVDCSILDNAPYFWVRDGDVIEVPER